MDYLYKIATKFSFEEYRKFNYALMKRKHVWVWIIVLCLFFLVAGIFVQERWPIIFAILYPFVFWGLTEYNIRKIFKSNAFYQDKVMEHELYDTYLIEKNDSGSVQIPYEKFIDAFETKTNFYFMIAKNQGCMISKENMSEECKEFLRKKMKK